jgi:hypothetical protein
MTGGLNEMDVNVAVQGLMDHVSWVVSKLRCATRT